MVTFLVDPARLECGTGDIAESYSADRIAEGRPIRKPFEWKGERWVCVAQHAQSGECAATAYRLRPWQRLTAPSKGELVSYSARVAVADMARADPKGFYHGMAVRHRGQSMALHGPPVLFMVTEEWEEREYEQL